MTTIQALVTTSPSSLSDLVTQAGSAAVPLFITIPQIVTTNLVIPANIDLFVLFGGAIVPNNSVTVTINGRVHADPFGWISLANGGVVTFNSGSNTVQRDFYADWWGLPFNTAIDAQPILTAMVAAIPDYSTITFNQKATLYLQNTWVIKNRTGLIIKAANLIEELPQFTFTTLSGLTTAMIRLAFCGHCTVEGFAFDDLIGLIAILIDQNGGGGTRICTNNTIAYNIFQNSASSQNWVGVSISPNADNNCEAMQLLHNIAFGFGTAVTGNGTGFQLGGGSNNHMHYLLRNQTYGCHYGHIAVWSGYYSSHGVSEGDQIAFSIGHLAYPTVIEFHDLEGTATFVQNTGGAESSIQIKYARIAGPYQNNVPIFDFNTPFVGTVLIEGCDYQNLFSTSPIVYNMPVLANGGNPGSLTLINNSYSNFINQGLPAANWIQRNGVNNQLEPVFEIFSEAEGLSGSYADLKSMNRNAAAQTVSANNINITGTVTKIINGGTINTAVLGLAYGQGILNDSEALFRATIWASGTGLTIAAAGGANSFKTSGTIAQDTMQAFLFDPVSALWYWEV